MIAPGVKIQERTCLSPCSTTVRTSCLGRNINDTFSLIRDSVKYGIRPQLASVVLEADETYRTNDQDGPVGTITLQGHSIASYNIIKQQCINSWSFSQGLLFSCPVRFLVSTPSDKTTNLIKDNDDVSIDLFSKQPGTLYAVIASGSEIHPSMAHRQVWLWKIFNEEDNQCPILNPESRIIINFEKPICHLVPVKKCLSVDEQPISFVIVVHSDLQISVMGEELKETLAVTSLNELDEVRLLWCDINVKSVTCINKVQNFASVYAIYENKNNTKAFSCYRINRKPCGKIVIELHKTINLPYFDTPSIPLVAIYQEEENSLVTYLENTECITVYNINSDSINYIKEIKLSNYVTTQQYPFPSIDLCDIGCGYFLVSGVNNNSDELLTVYDSRYIAKHYQKTFTDTNKNNCKTYFTSKSIQSQNNKFILLSKINIFSSDDILNYDFTVDIFPYSCMPKSSLTLLGKSIPYANNKDLSSDDVNGLFTNSFNLANNIVPYITCPSGFKYDYTLKSGIWSEYIKELSDLEKKYTILLCDERSTSSELDFDLTLCDFIRSRQKMVIKYNNLMCDGRTKKKRFPSYLNGNASRLLLSRLKVIDISQKSLISLLIRCFRNPSSFWPRSSMFYLLRCSFEISSTMFPFSLIGRSLSLGDLSMVEMLLNRIPDISEHELIEIMRWASGTENGIWNLNGDTFLIGIKLPTVARKNAMKTWIKEKVMEQTGQNSRPGYRSKKYLFKKSNEYSENKKSGLISIQSHLNMNISSIKSLIYRMVLYKRDYSKALMTQSLRFLFKINELHDLMSWCVREITGLSIQNITFNNISNISVTNVLLSGSEKSKYCLIKKRSSSFNCLNAMEILILLLESHFSTFLHTPGFHDCIKKLHRIVNNDVKITEYYYKKLDGPINSILDLVKRNKQGKTNKRCLKDHTCDIDRKKRLRRMLSDATGRSYEYEEYLIY